MRVGIFVLVVLLSGCLQSADDAANNALDAAGVEPAAPAVVAWGLSDCQAIAALLPADSAAVAPYLPEGFTALTFEEVVGSGTDIQGEANFGVEILVCAEGVGLNETVTNMVYGSYFMAIHPPTELAEDATFHFVKLDMLVPDAPRREFLQAAGMPVVDGTGAFQLFQGAANAGVTAATLTMDGATHTFRGTGGAPFDPVGNFVEFTPTADGLAIWRTDYTWRALGVGPMTVDVAGGTLAADVLGTGPSSGAAFVGVVTFSNASLTLPAQNQTATQ